MARTEPHAAYSAFTHCLQHRWSFVMRTIPGISLLLRPLENSIRNTFLPALLRSHTLGDDERALLTLPPRLGGMGITSSERLADGENLNSINLTRSLTEKIIAQDANCETDQNAILELKKTISRNRQRAQVESLEHLKNILPADTRLTCLPIRAKGFSLNKQEYVDAVALRYGWPVEGIPNTCACGSPNDVNHTMTCKKGGFVCIRHDEVRDVTASMLREVCRYVSTEPTLLPLDDEHMRYRTANTANEARVDISARGFWTRGQRAFMDFRIFDPMAACHQELSLETAHQRNEQEKIRAYGERIQHVDQGSFTSLVFTTSGGMGPKAKCFYSRLADVMAEKKHQPRSHVVAWMRCRLSFSLLRPCSPLLLHLVEQRKDRIHIWITLLENSDRLPPVDYPRTSICPPSALCVSPIQPHSLSVPSGPGVSVWPVVFFTGEWCVAGGTQLECLCVFALCGAGEREWE
ncbi:hypothetical protein GWK47_032746 [Chionoecetes opilio]|uniref:Uncharacterized protein n=1 Tax=Chionoecetes opilio TaxID=41210 RepID=A0A8J5CPW3_CHIOP|nr:hypothetical protein GWK47_032746 [Chionoecetes opilio]